MLKVLSVVFLTLGLASCSKVGGGEYFPLDEGMQWHYQLDYVMPDGKNKKGLTIRTVGQSSFKTEDDEIKGMVRRTSDGTDYFIQERADGFYRVGKRVIVQTKPQADKTARLILPKGRNLRVGYTWTQDTSPYVMHWMPPFIEANASIKPFDLVYEVASLDETVETPAGVFEKCIRLDGTGKMVFYADASAGYQEILINHSEWYAPGVGLVKLEREEPLNTSIMKGGKVTMALTRLLQ
ncbi:hypothetical protein [Limnobacter sp. 130]|jgi:hypothetical protein|uniref:hypothetical protein n=1 Tax=unclassified Limnobacter TaxID=2630203 RepID=UPI0012F46F40|nr:hypothetical protein [Limnobacter sp. 130]VWX37205.1 conserved hypothetical protein [Limnobacter sp. 130]